MTSILIAGTGKMARDIGARILGAGIDVHWLADDETCLVDIEKQSRKIIRRLDRIDPGMAARVRASSSLMTGSELPSFDVILETVVEDAPIKRAVIESILRFAGDEPLVLSNSSSIFPTDIHPRCVGMHFFYPVDLTCFVELITDDRASADFGQATVLAARLGLSVVVQGRGGAFVANRCLLPIQCELLRALQVGLSPSFLDTLPGGGILPAGQLSLMDSIGLKVITPAVKNYVAAMDETRRSDHEPLVRGLEEAPPGGIATSIAGGRDLGEADSKNLSRRLGALFVNTCLEMVNRGEVCRADMDDILSRALQLETSLGDEIGRVGTTYLRSVLSDAYAETGRHYFEPSTLLT